MRWSRGSAKACLCGPRVWGYVWEKRRDWRGSVCVCVCVCVRERESERERERERGTEGGRGAVGGRVCGRVSGILIMMSASPLHSSFLGSG